MLQIVKKKGVEVLTGATLKGELAWVTITGEGKDNYNEDGKEYSATIIFNKETGKQMQDTVQAYWDSVKSDADQQGSMGYRIGVFVDDGSDEPEEKFIAASKLTKKHKKSGRISYTFSSRTEWDDGKPCVIGLYNAKRKAIKLPEGKAIGNGSEGYLQVLIKRGTRGKVQFLSFYLQAVQLIKFVEYVGANDFEEVEDEDGFDDFDENKEEIDDGGAFADSLEETGEKAQTDDDVPM